MTAIVSRGFESARENERAFGKAQSAERFAKTADNKKAADLGGVKEQARRNNVGLTKKEMSQFYSVLDNDKKGLQVGKTGVLLVDDTPSGVIPNYTLICYYGDKISPVIKSVYKISNFEYNIYNSKMNLVNLLVDMEAKGVNVNFIRKALRDSLLDSKAVFKRYNRKTNRFNTLTKTNRTNTQHTLQNNQAGANRTGVSGKAQGGISGVYGNKQLNGKKSKDDTIMDNRQLIYTEDGDLSNTI